MKRGFMIHMRHVKKLQATNAAKSIQASCLIYGWVHLNRVNFVNQQREEKEKEPNLIEEMSMEAPAMLISSFMFLYLFVSFIKCFYKLWWKPVHIQKLLRSQGMNGPSYKCFHGDSKDILSMTTEAMKTPMESITHDILQRVQPHVDLWTKLYGRNFLTFRGHEAELFISEPELIKEVLTNKNGVYMKSDGGEFLKRLLGDGLVLAQGKKWTRQRKLANHAFRHENLKSMIPNMVASVEQMLERWASHGANEIEVSEEFRILTSDVISRTAFGSNYVDGLKIFDMLTELGNIIIRNTHKLPLPFLGKFIKSKDAMEAEKLEHEIRESFLQIIKTRKEKKHIGAHVNEYGSGYFGLLINANEDMDENKKISIDDMIDECKTFYFTGQETSMGSLTWTMFLLAVHQDWQQKAREEVFEIFGNNNPTSEDNGFAKMKKMTMIINETLRLYPPALNLGRTTASQVKLGDYIIPPNVYIAIPTLVSHNDPEIWGEDVLLFKPERFAEGVTGAAKNTNAYFPFGMGARNCVGSNYAIMEMKIVLSMILQRYAFSLSPSYVHSPVELMLTHPQHGVQIFLHAL